MTLLRYSDTRAVLEAVAAARADGREIVPLLGSGISTECGLLASDELVDYLTAFHRYVQQKAFAPQGLLEELGLEDRYRPGVAGYVRDLNWPDPREVIDGLWRWARSTDPPKLRTPAELADELRKERDWLAEMCGPDRAAGFRAAVEAVSPESVGVLRPGAVWDATGNWRDLLRRLTEFDRDHVEQLFTRLHRYPRPGLSHRFLSALVRILGVRMFLTVNFDSLLEQALSAEGIGYRLFVLEQGRPYPDPRHFRETVAVIKVHGGPDRLLQDERLGHPVEPAVLRAFAATFPENGVLLALGCDGRDQRLTDLVERGVLRGPLGGEPDAPGARGGWGRSAPRTRVIWLHTEEIAPAPVRKWVGEWSADGTGGPGARAAHPGPGPVLVAGVRSPGHFLRHLYGALTSRHPSGTVSYRAHSEGPVFLDAGTVDPIVYLSEPPTPDPNAVRVYRREDDRFTLFDSQGDEAGRPNPAAPTASERMAHWASAQRELTPIWIDLEGEFTIPGVVGAIVDQCRGFDPELAAVVLPFGEPTGAEALGRAADRIAEALRRGRYLLTLDGFETFPWPQTHHHGTSRAPDEQQKAITRLGDLATLLERLLDHPDGLGWSRVALSVNTPRGRDWGGGGAPLKHEQEVADEVGKKIQQLRRTLRATIVETIPVLAPVPEPNLKPDREDPYADVLCRCPWAPGAGPLSGPDADLVGRLFLFGVVCFRRTRSLVGLREVLGRFVAGRVPEAAPARGFGPGAEVDVVLDALCDARYLSRVEGGLFWMNRELRDRIYSGHSRQTRTEALARILAGEPPSAACLAQLLLLALFQDAIARYYYFDTFIPSRDPHAFFEYVYHRTSSIRYLTRLVLVLELGRRHPAPPGWSALYARLKGLCEPPFDLSANEVFLEAVEKEPQWQELIDRLNERRAREIASLRLAWSFAARELLVRVPPDQLVSWCQWQIDDDLPKFATRFYPDFAPRFYPEVLSAARAAGHLELCAGLDRRAGGEVAALRRDLYTLWAQCNRERNDPEGCARVSFRHIRAVLSAARVTEATDGWPGRLIRVADAHAGPHPVPLETLDWHTLGAIVTDLQKQLGQQGRLKELDVRGEALLADALTELRAGVRAGGAKGTVGRVADRLRAALTGLVADRVRAALSGTTPEPEPELTTDQLIGVLAAIEVGVRAGLPVVERASVGVVLGALADVVECLAAVTDRAGSGADEKERNGAWDALEGAARLVERALFLRVVLARATACLPLEQNPDARSRAEAAAELAKRGLVETRRLHPPDRITGPQAPYFHYRSLLLVTRGTARWLGRADDGTDAMFKRAYQDYERARGTIEPAPDRTLAAEIDLRAAACGLAHGDWHLRPGAQVPEGTEQPEVLLLARADAKYVIADEYLRRAGEHLLHARRNVVWWGEYFRLYARAKSRRNLWRAARFVALCRYEDRSRALDWLARRHVVPRFSRTLRQGLLAVRRGRDLELQRRPGAWHEQALREFYRTLRWFVATCAVEWGARLELAQSELGSHTALYWEWLLRAVGITDWTTPDENLPPEDGSLDARALRRWLTDGAPPTAPNPGG
jgi:hypothetical protein